MRRRSFVPLMGSALLWASKFGIARGHADDAAPQGEPDAKVTLASAPIEMTGDWGGSLPHSAQLVVSRMREACLAGVRLMSDRQPEKIRVENHASGPPHIWLHFDRAPFAWIVVDIGPRDWSKLAYQFGHEFGHVVCNIWSPEGNAANARAAAWLEEALVEAFSIHGLGPLADSWARDPPFAGDSAFAGAIRQYRDHLVTKYRTIATEQGTTADLAAWFPARRDALASNGDINGPGSGAVMAILAEMTADPSAIEGLGALNRWPPQSGLSVEDTLRLWTQSCAGLGASQRLPMRLRQLLIG